MRASPEHGQACWGYLCEPEGGGTGHKRKGPVLGGKWERGVGLLGPLTVPPHPSLLSPLPPAHLPTP